MIESLSTATVSQLRSEIEATKEALATCEKLIGQLKEMGYSLDAPQQVVIALSVNLGFLREALAEKGVGVEG